MLRPRGMGIMDFIAKTGADLLTPPQASPVFQGRTPLQTSMGRPEAQFSQPSASTMATTMPSGTMAMASPTPQIQSMMRGQAPARTAAVTPPQVTAARPQMLEPNRMMGERGAVGSGVMQEGMDREKMIAAAKVAEVEAKNPELKADPSFQDRVKGLFGDREKMLGLALAFNSMRLRPDTGLATIIGSELKDIRDTRKLQAASNRTADALEKFDPKLAQAVREGMDPKTAIEMYQSQRKGVVVGKKIVNPYTSQVIYDGTGEDGELPAAYRALQLRAEAAGLKPGTAPFNQFMINGGQKAGLMVETRPDGTFLITEGGATGTGKAQTEGQSKALAFSTRMATSQDTINLFENEGTSIRNWIAEALPVGGNFLSTPQFKEYSQAKRNFVNALLRWESGAAIGPAEFQSADIQYFPQPGDTQAVIDQKRANRDVMIRVMQNVAGAGNEEKAREYSKQIKVEIFGAKAANWPDAGEVKTDDDTGDKYVFKGGDPNIETNWVKQ